MYLRNNIWGSHRQDQLRKRCFHFTEGHSSRRLFIFCRRSMSAAIAIGCGANQGTDILIADNIKKAKPGQQDTNILLTKTKVPTSLNQKSWCKLFGWRLLNHATGWTPQVGSCHPARFRALLSSPFRIDVYFWCLDTKYPLCQQSDLAATFGGRPHKQARFPVRLTKAQNLWYRGDPFHSKRCLGTKNRCDLCVPHPCCTMSLRILHLCLLRGLGKDGHTLAQHIGFCKNHSKCRVFQVHVQVRHRHDAAACAVALSTGDKKNKMRCLPKAQESVTCKLVRTSKFKTHASSRKIFGTQGRWLSSKSAINAGYACATSNWHSWGVLTSAGDACEALSDSWKPRCRTTACACGSSRHGHRSDAEAQRRGAMPIHFKATRQSWNQSARTRPLHWPADCLAALSNQPQVHCGKNCPAVFLLRCTTMRALFLATARLLVHFCFALFACPV